MVDIISSGILNLFSRTYIHGSNSLMCIVRVTEGKGIKEAGLIHSTPVDVKQEVCSMAGLHYCALLLMIRQQDRQSSKR